MRLLPRKVEFFDLLDQQATNVVTLCERFAEMVREFTDLEQRQAGIKELEHAGDRITHELFSAMHATFVTPLDKDDLAALASGLDDIADYVDAAGDRFLLYQVEKPGSDAQELAELLVATARLVCESVKSVRSMKNREKFFEAFREIHELENQSDAVYRRALSTLFNAPNPDPVHLIKWKEIFERMEMAVDKCEDVGNVIEGIILKYT